MEEKSKNKSMEIDIIGIVKKVLKEKKLLAYFIIVSAVIGVIVALSTPKQYTANVVLAPELSSGGSLPEGLSNIASMVGVDLGGMSNSSLDAIYPQIYPDVLTSSDFIVKLFDIKVKQEKDSTETTYFDHLTKGVKPPFWSYPMIWLGELLKPKEETDDKTIHNFRLTKKQDNVLKMVRANITCIVDKNTNVISISVTDFDRLVAATMVDTIQKQLQQYIVLYRTKKSRNDVEYTQKLFYESKEQYLKAQQEYSAFVDANSDIMLETFKSKRDLLENEMQLRYNIYNQIAQQLQIAKAKVQERTPVFSVIQSASVPIKASSMPRSFIVIIYVFVGVMADMLWVIYLRDFYKENIKKKNKQ